MDCSDFAIVGGYGSPGLWIVFLHEFIKLINHVSTDVFRSAIHNFPVNIRIDWKQALL